MKKVKRTAGIVFLLLLMAGTPVSTALAHGPHHHSYSHQKEVYCRYHDCYHNQKSDCSRYCPRHKTIHKNGKRHYKNARSKRNNNGYHQRCR